MGYLMALVALVALGGCAGQTLPYKAEPQPGGSRIAAAYQVVAGRLRVEIATDGQRLEEAKIVRQDGATVYPQTIEHAQVVQGGSPVGIGFGIGGGSFGGRSGVGVGTGVSVGIPVGGAPSTLPGNTIAWFPLDQVGPGPWRLLVKLPLTEPATIILGNP
jgi:hypothetical protein